jgi:hypothetical protein
MCHRRRRRWLIRHAILFCPQRQSPHPGAACSASGPRHPPQRPCSGPAVAQPAGLRAALLTSRKHIQLGIPTIAKGTLGRIPPWQQRVYPKARVGSPSGFDTRLRSTDCQPGSFSPGARSRAARCLFTSPTIPTRTWLPGPRPCSPTSAVAAATQHNAQPNSHRSELFCHSPFNRCVCIADCRPRK